MSQSRKYVTYTIKLSDAIFFLNLERALVLKCVACTEGN